ncbi:MAG: thioredoxin-dependent thiol peroxidase [Trueperaceae bacterium]
MLEVGQAAPAFTLVDQDGTSRSLADVRGKWLVLYFYPKDDTPGCTKEACAFRDGLPHFEGLDAVVWGVSADDGKAHRKFADKYDLNFPLLVDPEKDVLEAYGAWTEKSMYGKTYMGVQRITYVIDPSGNVARAWPKVKPEEHADEVAAAIEELRA